MTSLTTQRDLLDTFDHVVVLMLENRSFDNVLGYLYEDGVPSGKSFEGAEGQWNPDHLGRGQIFTSRTHNYDQPYPDPGEFYQEVMEQMYGKSFADIDPARDPLTMKGFVRDYYNVLKQLTEIPWPFKYFDNAACQSRKNMKCFAPSAVPAITTLAREFAVFDHWFCALPSETWPNRAFWHADTSWGWVNNPAGPDKDWHIDRWFEKSATPTLFSALDKVFPGERANWRVYEDLIVAATKLIHLGNLWDKTGPDYFRYLEYAGGPHTNFFQDCASGDLPKYAFIEPHLFNFVSRGLWHNDMHPSEWLQSLAWAFLMRGGPGTALLGDELILKVYEAIRNSPARDRTLLIITFDEHGGCFDHVAPPTATPPDTRPFNDPFGIPATQNGFDFKRLGPRVPMVMVSSHIQKNTIVNTPMHHGSFLKTMQRKWGFDSLGPRSAGAPDFADAILTKETRAWQDLSGLHKGRSARRLPRPETPISKLQSTLVAAMHAAQQRHGRGRGGEMPNAKTFREAQALLDRIDDFKHLGRGY